MGTSIWYTAWFLNDVLDGFHSGMLRAHAFATWESTVHVPLLAYESLCLLSRKILWTFFFGFAWGFSSEKGKDSSEFSVVFFSFSNKQSMKGPPQFRGYSEHFSAQNSGREFENSSSFRSAPFSDLSEKHHICRLSLIRHAFSEFCGNVRTAPKPKLDHILEWTDVACTPTLVTLETSSADVPHSLLWPLQDEVAKCNVENRRFSSSFRTNNRFKSRPPASARILPLSGDVVLSLRRKLVIMNDKQQLVAPFFRGWLATSHCRPLSDQCHEKMSRRPSSQVLSFFPALDHCFQPPHSNRMLPRRGRFLATPFLRLWPQ